MRIAAALIMFGLAFGCAPPPLGEAAAPFRAGDPPQTPGPLAGSDGALGSGCAPGAGALPDGAWYGYAVNWDATGLDFDLACFYVGAAADAQAAARNDEEPPNGFYLVNDSPTTRRLPIDAATPAYRLALPGDVVGLERTTYREMVTDPPSGISPCPGEWCSVWVFVNDGRVTEVMQQYLP